ncbi:hypothetical protein BDZ45DRAFT_804084 [Acephala macrosclerotiorum]|nr:hypothetical protein BDZ45DRAFT_804084 [Acephala macrosclerotiorum]
MSSNYMSLNLTNSLPAYGMSAVNCTIYPPLQANSDISGIGVLASFLATAYLTLVCCIAKCTLDHRQKKAAGKRALRIGRWSFAFEKAIVAFSDQQLVTRVSVVVGGFQQLEWGLPVYYFQQVANLAWFSTITHILTLTILRDKMQSKSSTLIKTIRIVLMGCLVVMLACVIAPLGYLSSAYGTWGFRAFENSTVQGLFPMEFPSWCLYNPSAVWADENGQPMVHVGAYGYNMSYIIITIGNILYEAYFDFTEDMASSIRANPNDAGAGASTPPTLSLHEHETELQYEIKNKRWYRSLLVLWGLMSFMIGAFSLTVLAPGGGVDWSPVNQFTAGESGLSSGSSLEDIPVYYGSRYRASVVVRPHYAT